MYQDCYYLKETNLFQASAKIKKKRSLDQMFFFLITVIYSNLFDDTMRTKPK